MLLTPLRLCLIVFINTKYTNIKYHSLRLLFRGSSIVAFLVTFAVNTMAENPPDGSMATTEGGSKKELSYDQLKAYVHKARVKIKKLEQEKESLQQQADESSASQTASAGEIAAALR